VDTQSIRSRVRQNLNRDDPGIDAKIQGWINDARWFMEQARNYDYMRATSTTTTTTATVALPANLKSLIDVWWGEDGQTWHRLPRLSDVQTREIGPDTGSPLGYTVGESSITLWPAPDKQYYIRFLYWKYSSDWQFTAGEEPYLARVAWPAIVALATAYGYEYLGEHQDAQAWMQRAAARAREFAASEAARALEGEHTLRARSGARL